VRAAAASVALVLAVPAAGTASASPLLSGYGGPGEGNQAILGSTLLGGPSSGGGGDSSARSLVQSATSIGVAGGSGAALAGRGAAGRRRQSRGALGGTPATSKRSTRGAAAAVPPVSIDAPKGEVLSSADLEYILLALAGLAATGFLTRRLARQQRRTMQGR
jgi:hypothetical protein